MVTQSNVNAKPQSQPIPAKDPLNRSTDTHAQRPLQGILLRQSGMKHAVCVYGRYVYQQYGQEVDMVEN